MLCNYLEVASATMPIKIPKIITGIKLVIIEIPKVAKRDLLIWRLNIVKHTQNVKIANAIDANINIVIQLLPLLLLLCIWFLSSFILAFYYEKKC